MPDFLVHFAARLAGMLPVFVLISALSWSVLKQLGYMSTGAFNPADMRTWPLGLVIIDAVIFALIFAAIYTAMGDSALTAGVAGGLSVLVAMNIAPRLAAKILT